MRIPAARLAFETIKTGEKYMNKVFNVEVKFNPGGASDIHFAEFVKQVKDAFYINVSKGTASARTINVREVVQGEE